MRETQSLPVGTTKRATGPHELRGEKYFTDLAYRKAGKSRFTQDSPILADVFVHYGLAKDKSERIDLLLTPDWSREPSEVADELRFWLGSDASADPPDEKWNFDDEREDPHQIAYNQSVVASRLTFEELVCNVLPMSWWWQNRLIALPGRTPVDICSDSRLCDLARLQLLAGLSIEIEAEETAAKNGDSAMTWEKRHWLIRQDLAWAARLFYIVQNSNIDGQWHRQADDPEAIADHFFGLVKQIDKRQTESKTKDKNKTAPASAWVYSINRNRKLERAVHDSVKTAKADAARLTFEVTGEGICWAIIDTGVDACHIAFRKKDESGLPHGQAFEEEDGPGDDADKNKTRVRGTYDFSEIRSRLHKWQRRALKAGRLLDWETLEGKLALKVPHTRRGYRTPVSSHGTHVAGILAADWQPEPTAVDPLGPPPTKRVLTRALTGLCPKIEIYDLRVFKANGVGDEFAVMSALQFVRSLNQRHDKLEVHGVNLSLAMGHEVSNYACGRSPVCEECTRLVGNGVVVVAAAGNDARAIYTTTQHQRQEGYRTVSIADPGNTEVAITVGSTHRRDPHTYGVSYFSSRGPTGDGRMKPDLVAPGEKILSTVPGDGFALEDGTSQAAPHVSGAAALLMSRHRELIGEPARVKRVLMDTATDLGRERYFQGAGLVDVMRAIQSL